MSIEEAAIVSAIAAAIAAIASWLALLINLFSIKQSVLPVLVADLDDTKSIFFPDLKISNLGKGTAFNVRLENHLWFFADTKQKGTLVIKSTKPIHLKQNASESLKLTLKGLFEDEDFGSHMLQQKGKKGLIFTDQRGKLYRTRFYIDEQGKMAKVGKTSRFYWYHRVYDSFYIKAYAKLKFALDGWKYDRKLKSDG